MPLSSADQLAGQGYKYTRMASTEKFARRSCKSGVLFLVVLGTMFGASTSTSGVPFWAIIRRKLAYPSTLKTLGGILVSFRLMVMITIYYMHRKDLDHG